MFLHLALSAKALDTPYLREMNKDQYLYNVIKFFTKGCLFAIRWLKN